MFSFHIASLSTHTISATLPHPVILLISRLLGRSFLFPARALRQPFIYGQRCGFRRTLPSLVRPLPSPIRRTIPPPSPRRPRRLGLRSPAARACWSMRSGSCRELRADDAGCRSSWKGHGSLGWALPPVCGSAGGRGRRVRRGRARISGGHGPRESVGLEECPCALCVRRLRAPGACTRLGTAIF